MHLPVTFRCAILAIALLGCSLPRHALAINECKKHDKSFEIFLSKFEEDMVFQRSRIVMPLVSREGNYFTTDPKIELLDIDAIEKLANPLILSKKEMKSQNVQDYIIIKTDAFAELLQDQYESDANRVLFTFRNIDGCWYLEEMHDESM